MAFKSRIWFLLSLCLVLCSHATFAALPHGRRASKILRRPGVPYVVMDPSTPVIGKDGSTLPPYNTVYYFNQLIDHNNPSLGTFKQRYLFTREFYDKGGPIILWTPGEFNAERFSGYLTNKTLNGQIAQRQNGATIVLEHRFFGLSNPRPDLTVQSLRLLNLQQVVEDFVYFAKHVTLPMPGGDMVSPDKAPWILTGGSYSGALTAYIMAAKPGVFYAGHASSAVVEATLNFWQFFDTIRINMPHNCSADVQVVVAHIDRVLSAGNETAIKALKDSFGLGDLRLATDFVFALKWNLADWASLQPHTGPGSKFFQFCDILEVKNGETASRHGWGLDHALSAWASYYKNIYYNFLCGDQDVQACLSTDDPTDTYWTNTTIDNENRSWFWLECNEVGFFLESPPRHHPSLVSRHMKASYGMKVCPLMFPDAFPKPEISHMVQDAEQSIAETNHRFHGWSLNVSHLFFANGIRDPWREATMSARSQAGKIKSTNWQPIALSHGFHTSDLLTAAGQADSSVLAVQTQSLDAMANWLKKWKPSH